MITTLVPIEKVIPYARNPRKNLVAIGVVARSIAAFGFRQPILVDKDYVVIAGHTRLEAARSLGLVEVPVVVADHLTEQQVKAYRIADNKLAEVSEWDREKLTRELQTLLDAGYDTALTALYESEIDVLLAERDGNKLNPSMAASSAEKISKFNPPNFVVGKYNIPMSEHEIAALKVWADNYVATNGSVDGMLTALLDVTEPPAEEQAEEAPLA
jgi:ParB-like chromosome segregation protein Spo0J